MSLPLPSVNKFDWVRALSAQPSSIVTRTEHHVALALAGYLNQHGTGFVTHARLASDCRVSERTVCTALSALVSKGWLLRHSGKAGRASDYWTHLPADAAPPQPARHARNSRVDVENYLTVLAQQCGLPKIMAVPGSDSLERLTGALARTLAAIADRPDDISRLFHRLTEGSLASANDPAAVLLHRLGQIMRADATLHRSTPCGDTAGRQLVEDAVDVFLSGTRHK
jgi:DNA-binding FadR family transcriptional regulator